jgi:hypothetical protein
MPTIRIPIRPSPIIEFADIFNIKVFRKANTTTPADSYLEDEFVEEPTLTITRSFDNPAIVDANGHDDYWYRAQTCEQDRCAPMGPNLPGHGASSFAVLRSGLGYLSAFTPNALDAIFLYDEVHKATEFVVEHLLRPKFELATVLGQYKDPLPAVRQITEVVAATSIIGQRRPSDTDALEFLKSQYARLSKEFALKRSYQARTIEEVVADRSDPAELMQDWGR